MSRRSTRVGIAGGRSRRASPRWTIGSCTSFRFLPGCVHRDRGRLREPVGNCLQSSRKIRRILARWTATTHSVVGPNCCMVEETCALSPPGSAEEGHARLFFPVVKARSVKKSAKRLAPSGDGGASSEAPMPSRVSGHNARSHGRNCCQAGRPRSLRWDCAHSTTVQFESCDVGASCCLAKVDRPSAARSSHSVQASVVSVSLSSQFARSHQKAMHSTAADQEEEGCSGGAACPGAAHSTHPSRAPWSYHCGGRDESAGGSDDFSQAILELATSRKRNISFTTADFRTLRRVIVMVAGALNEGRIGGFERQHGTLCQIYGMLESAAKDSTIRPEVGPLLGLSDPDALPDVHWSPADIA